MKLTSTYFFAIKSLQNLSWEIFLKRKAFSSSRSKVTFILALTFLTSEKFIRFPKIMNSMSRKVNSTAAGMRMSENGTMLDVNGNVICRGTTAFGTPVEFPLAGIRTPNAEGLLSPRAGVSASAFCTSSEDVLSAFNFSKDDDDSAFGYEQINSRESQNASKITLVCGDLFRKVARNGNTLASILLEPQNKTLLQNFLDDFNGTHLVPWAVGASLKHWARKFSLFENEDTESSTGLTLLKTTQKLTPRGEVDDPKALERLEQAVDNYLKNLEAEGPIQQAVSTIGTFVKYICDTDPAKTADGSGASSGAGASGGAFSVEPNFDVRTRNRKSDFQETYQRILDELRMAEAEIVEMEAEAGRSMTPKKPSTELLLHRIAGFDSFVGFVGPTSTDSDVGATDSSKASQTDVALLFPSNTVPMATGFSKTPSKSCTPRTSKHQLLAAAMSPAVTSVPSRPRLRPDADENGNWIDAVEATSSEVIVQKSDENLFLTRTTSEIFSEAGEEIVNDIVQRIWNDDPEFSELERSVMGMAEYTESEEEVEKPSEQPTGLTVTFPAVGLNQSLEEPPSENSKSGSAVMAKTNPLNQTDKKCASGKPKSPNPSQKQVVKSVPKKPIAPAVGNKGQTGSKIRKTTTSQPPRSGKPQIAFGAKVDSRWTNLLSQPRPATKPSTRAPSLPKVAPGCRRIEFTKVKQTVSYRQLNKENIEHLNQPSGSRVDPESRMSRAVTEAVAIRDIPEPVGPVVLTHVDPAMAAKKELAQLIEVEMKLSIPRDIHTAPQSSANLAPVFDTQNVQPFASTPSSLGTSRGPSVTKMPFNAGQNRKSALTYTEIRQQKKLFEQTQKTGVAKGGNTEGVKAVKSAGTGNSRRFK